MLTSRFRTYLLVVGIGLFGIALLLDRFESRSIQSVASDASRAFQERHLLSEHIAESALKDSAGPIAHWWDEHNIGVYIMDHDSLVEWNNSRFPVRTAALLSADTNGLIKFANGIYYAVTIRKGSRTAVALSIVRYVYSLQNKYLNNHFASWTGLPAEVGVCSNLQGTAVTIGQKVLFNICGPEDRYYSELHSESGFVLVALGLIFLLLYLLAVNHHGQLRSSIYITLGVLLLRAAMIYFHFPAFLSRSSLYDVHLFGNATSTWFGYLGDILINSIIIVFLVVLWLRGPAVWRTTVLWLALLGSIVLFHRLCGSLVANSTLNFDLLNIFDIHPLTFVGLGSLCILSFAVLAGMRGMASALKEFNNRGAGIYLILNMVLCACVYIFTRSEVFFWPSIIGYTAWMLNGQTVRKTAFIATHVIVVSLVTTYLLMQQGAEIRKQDLRLIAQKLAEKQDPALENEFAAVAQRAAHDDNLSALMNLLPITSEEVPKLLSLKYFNGYFQRYHIDYSIFDEKCNPLIPHSNGLLDNEGYFLDQIAYQSEQASVPDLHLVKNFKKTTRYIGKIDEGKRRIYVMMDLKQLEEAGSFPDLLLDQSQQRQEKIRHLSYAIYRSGQLNASYGPFPYPALLPDSTALAATDATSVPHIYRMEEATDVVINTPKSTGSAFFTFNSYVILFDALLAFLAYLIYSSGFTAAWSGSSLTRRIQAIIVTLLITSLLSVGVISGRLVTRQFNDDNYKQLKEKGAIIIDELTTRMKAGQLFESPQKELVNQSLVDFSRLFKTDISLFNVEGRLYNTSQPKLYELGLASVYANPVALRQLKNKSSSAFLVEERAGKLRYLSLYMPIYNSAHRLEGYVNLPYFARQGDLADELSGIVSAFINVYVVLFIVSLLIGLVLSGYITRPLRLIQQQLASITFGRNNEKIRWNSNDEIGRLVNEYNLMLNKLEESAQMLARSEREGAWREMAKQVAHEIKNPLTPMKLNLQYLQHLLTADPESFRERFEKASSGIIEQIDSLANIASEFSSLARLPGTTLTSVNLNEVIESAVQLFNRERAVIHFNPVRTVHILGDREQCLRVFNNVIKNAVQATEDIGKPEINISLTEPGHGKVLVTVTDNGTGMTDEQAEKIFTPNFTTKSTGSGLGLTMVRNIMEDMNGNIWFETHLGKGTTFFLQFNSERS